MYIRQKADQLYKEVPRETIIAITVFATFQDMKLATKEKLLDIICIPLKV